MKKIYYLFAMAFMAITFTSCEDVPEAYGKPVSPIIPYEPAGTGVETDPFNVAGAIEKCKEIGTKASTEKFYIKGYAAGAAEVDGGKVTFTMTDSKEGKGKKFTAYKVAGSDNKSLPSDFAVSIGEEIVIYGPIYNYSNKTPETATGAYIVTVNGEKTGSNTPGGDTDKGTEDKPFDVASAISAGEMTGVYLKGYIVGTAYSNQETKQTEWNFGTTNAQASNLLLAATATETDYTKCMPVALPSGSAIRTSLNIKDNPGNLGKEVLLYGNLTKYFSQPGMKETSYAVLDGTAIGTKPGGGDTPSGEAKTVTVSQFLAASESTTEWYQLTGTVTHLEDGTYKNSTQYGNFDLVDETGTIYVYGVVAEKGGTKGKFAELMTAKGIKDGSKITIIGNRGSYNGTAQVVNAYFVSVESGESGGGSGGGDTPSTGLEASFDNGQGDFTIEDKELGGLTFVWKADTKNKYMKASAFANSTNNAAESWLVSPAFSLKNTTAPVMTFNNACNYVKEGTITDHIKVMVYDGTNWTEATISNLPNGSSWDFVDSTVDLTSVAGKEGVKIAFRYVSTTAVAPTWEIKTVSVK